MKWGYGILAAAVVAAATAAALHATLRTAANGQWPAPIDGGPGERDPDFKLRRGEWIESLHRHAPGLDWRAQDAQWRALRMDRVQRERQATLASGAAPESLRRVELDQVGGVWSERGSSNQAGRVTGALYDAAADRLTVLSQGGNVWRAQRASLDWVSLNDTASFGSSGFIDRLGGAGERLLLASDTPLGVYFSDDGGSSFSAATGADLANPWYTSGMAVRDASAEVYVARVHYDGAAANWRTALFASVDRGSSFSPLGFVGERDRAALFSPRYGAPEVYVLADATLKRIVSGTQALATVGTVPVSPAVANGDRVHLAGGVAGGQTFLYAFYSRAGASRTDVYRSLDGGITWAARTSIPENTFGPNSAAASTRDPQIAYAGGVNLYRSADGGSSWSKVNDWGEYYGDPASKLHADIPRIDVWLDSANVERIYVSTDGGLYESSDDLATVHNLSLTGLHISQYYTTYTQRGAAGVVFAGAQDQGYQKALAPAGGIDEFSQVISGDYGQMTSSDGGGNLWMVYPNFAMLDTAPNAGNQSGLRLWQYGDAGLTGTLWMTPIVADPSNPRRVLLAGGRMSGSGNHVVNLEWSGSGFVANQEPFDFGSPLTALAFSSQVARKRYAISSANTFFRDSGGGWANTASGMPQGHYFYGNKILSDATRNDTVYVAGAGYSSASVFVSSDDGSSFTPMSNGLPNTMVFDLAMSADGAHLFAATEVGPFYFDRTQGRWVDISGLGAPDQAYWAVDYIDEANGGVARFATYGRGIWDFRIADEVVFRDGFDP